MSERPDLNRQLDGNTFRKFYYLKEELVEFCRENKLPVSGGKMELTERIAYYLDTGNVLAASLKAKRTKNIGIITEETKIEPNIVCSEQHRAFFKEKIGNSFSFNVAFQKWLIRRWYYENLFEYDKQKWFQRTGESVTIYERD